MNCATSQIQRIATAVSEVLKTFEDKYCSNCGNSLLRLHLYRNAYHCSACQAEVCVICGCTDEVNCPAGCYWIGPGLCSTHKVELDEALARTAQPRAPLHAVR